MANQNQSPKPKRSGIVVIAIIAVITLLFLLPYWLWGTSPEMPPAEEPTEETGGNFINLLFWLIGAGIVGIVTSSLAKAGNIEKGGVIAGYAVAGLMVLLGIYLNWPGLPDLASLGGEESEGINLFGFNTNVTWWSPEFWLYLAIALALVASLFLFSSGTWEIIRSAGGLSYRLAQVLWGFIFLVGGTVLFFGPETVIRTTSALLTWSRNDGLKGVTALEELVENPPIGPADSWTDSIVGLPFWVWLVVALLIATLYVMLGRGSGGGAGGAASTTSGSTAGPSAVGKFFGGLWKFVKGAVTVILVAVLLGGAVIAYHVASAQHWLPGMGPEVRVHNLNFRTEPVGHTFEVLMAPHDKVVTTMSRGHVVCGAMDRGQQVANFAGRYDFHPLKFTQSGRKVTWEYHPEAKAVLVKNGTEETWVNFTLASGRCP